MQHQMKSVDMQCENENVCPIINSGMRKSSQFSHHVRHLNYNSTLHAVLKAESYISLSKVLLS